MGMFYKSLREANPEKGKTKETRDKDRTHTEGIERKNDKSRAMWQASVNPNCILCKENHNTGQCPTYSFENKLARLRELKLCSRCGKPWHPNKCPIKNPCRKCQGEHYTYLCCKKQVQTNITHKGEHPKEVEVKRTEGTNVKKVNAKGGGFALPTAQLDGALARMKAEVRRARDEAEKANKVRQQEERVHAR